MVMLIVCKQRFTRQRAGIDGAVRQAAITGGVLECSGDGEPRGEGLAFARDSGRRLGGTQYCHIPSAILPLIITRVTSCHKMSY